ncbi:hypothetical protein HYFRA_00009667 [Hymenoscyphus fraxineus]|uniref:Uncharacterized protein n=1 Tax=Hymenoscyphus fraxineus TaxID=746836 RepID=A0A9N9KUV6_9HELO|nr:hypothetical protein HYFRA_00009667 [Hymenoscyphus fraxineus]
MVERSEVRLTHPIKERLYLAQTRRQVVIIEKAVSTNNVGPFDSSGTSIVTSTMEAILVEEEVREDKGLPQKKDVTKACESQVKDFPKTNNGECLQPYTER